MQTPRDRMLRRAERQQARYLRRPVAGSRLAGKIPVPDRARQALTAAFVKAFEVVLDKGDGLIHKGLDTDGLRVAFAAQDRKAMARMNSKNLRAVGAQARRVRRRGAGVALAEGVGLGLVGVGLPDIPLFLGVVLRGVYQIALSYGIDYRTPAERAYLLALIDCAAAPDADKQRALDQAARRLYAGAPIPIDEQALRRRAAESLAEGMLTAKFVQGLPLVGAAGGAYNLPLYRRITGYAETQYRKRYLWSKS